jgi:hypothetical protein
MIAFDREEEGVSGSPYVYREKPRMCSQYKLQVHGGFALRFPDDVSLYSS